MGNACEGGAYDYNREIQETIQTHRKMMEEYERKIREKEAVLTSRIDTFNSERERFEQEKN